MPTSRKKHLKLQPSQNPMSPTSGEFQPNSPNQQISMSQIQAPDYLSEKLGAKKEKYHHISGKTETCIHLQKFIHTKTLSTDSVTNLSHIKSRGQHIIELQTTSPLLYRYTSLIASLREWFYMSQNVVIDHTGGEGVLWVPKPLFCNWQRCKKQFD